MTRASLLHILHHVTHISQAEVRELEQLAAAFPYCQTAHLLLAKAAHDQGSMLASQRLRHAATYAADRELLRRLIETSPAALLVDSPTHLVPAAAEAGVSAPVEVDLPPTPETNASESLAALASEESNPDLPAPLLEAAAEQPSATVTEEANAGPEPSFHTDSVVATDWSETVAEAEFPAKDALASEPLEEALLAEDAENLVPTTTAAANADSHPAELPVERVAQEENTEDASLEVEAEAAIVEETPVLLPAPTSEEEVIAEPADQPEAVTIVALPDDLPAVAPPIRAPADAGFSRFEYGFEEPDSVAVPVLYELPEVDDAARQKTPPFYADPSIGYGLGSSSRLGYALEAGEAGMLPLPLEAFFEPDALLLAHLEAYKPAPLPTSIDLINRFLKNKPRLKSPATLPGPTDEQADLSVRSTSSVPELASESLAKIMVRQGKVAKAIEIYERLMVRQPEKKAYFADQIQHLKLSQ
ncbi:hypothetical protein FY528_17550 [Hymenobacter lutimineralis]|uniref:Tetratricopeptide repeat protein n=1 Tax=Hymenobacter lutimineralis TaxID=2606448 RepID=A0A5D6USH8_9BACT|nr:hypothetical protein [Hymenobacter lutimineralis]TYZ06671.1 hypothetical protein FY528_17550 [Hymenobacter lutimineralis]